MVSGGGDRGEESIFDALGPVDPDARYAEARSAVDLAQDVLNRMRADGRIAAAARMVAARMVEAHQSIDGLVDHWEETEGRLPLRAWRLLRELLRAEIEMRRTMLGWFGGRQPRERGGR